MQSLGLSRSNYLSKHSVSLTILMVSGHQALLCTSIWICVTGSININKLKVRAYDCPQCLIIIMVIGTGHLPLRRSRLDATKVFRRGKVFQVCRYQLCYAVASVQEKSPWRIFFPTISIVNNFSVLREAVMSCL